MFEDLRILIGCEFISDIRIEPYRHEACQILISSTLVGYPLEQWKDMLKYFLGGNGEITQINAENEAKSLLKRYLKEL